MFTVTLFILLTVAFAFPIDRRDIFTSNALMDGPCMPVTVIFARGTTEAGNIGAIIGPELSAELDKQLGGNVAFQGVDYSASIAGYLEGGNPDGATQLVSLVNTASTKCPSTQIVLSGYSQGAQIVYKGAAQLSSDLAGQISAAVLFGNPNDGQAVPNIDNANVQTYCHNGDLICSGEPIVLPPHLTYGLDAPAAASFISGKVNI